MAYVFFRLFWLIAGLISSCSSHLIFKKVLYEFGCNLGEHVSNKILGHLRSTNVEMEPFDIASKYLKSPDTLVLSVGNATLALHHINNVQNDKYESYRIKVLAYKSRGAYLLVSNGRLLDDSIHKNLSFHREAVHYGAVLGAYASLELLGFRFLHPLQAYVPDGISLSNTTIPQDYYEFPHWPERSWHIHTQHPLELTEVLQGFDIPHFGGHGAKCTQPGKVQNENTPYCERWEDMIDDVDKLFEWIIANRLNKVEWLLLGHRLWGDEGESRQHRLRIITDLGHKYSLMIGVDCPLGNIQQHGWYMVNTRLTFAEQIDQIRLRVDWVFEAGFDFLTTESGMSEFTHPECSLMLDMLNYYAIYTNKTYGKEAGVKVHCSTGQTCPDYFDPRTNLPVNFNFLPMFAAPELGVFPHTQYRAIVSMIRLRARMEMTTSVPSKSFSYILPNQGIVLSPTMERLLIG